MKEITSKFLEQNTRQSHKAVALKYIGGHAAPRVVATGNGLLAEKIIALAQEHDIPLHEDPELVLLLAEIGLDEKIPEELYKAVAAVLAFVYNINNRLPDLLKSPTS